MRTFISYVVILDSRFKYSNEENASLHYLWCACNVCSHGEHGYVSLQLAIRVEVETMNVKRT